VALAGLPRRKYKLENLRNDHQQLTSRVRVLLEVKRTGKPDAVKIIEGVWSGLAKETVGALVKTANGSVRTLVKLMGRVHQVMGINRGGYGRLTGQNARRRAWIRPQSQEGSAL
jgi:DNA transposition AAA+ family ATPase